jgi:hypothetical protein
MLPEPKLTTSKLAVGGVLDDNAAINCNEDGPTPRIDSEFTTSVTFTDCVLLLDEKITVPVYVPGTSAPIVAEICTVLGVWPEVGWTVSQLPPDCVAAATVQLMADDPVVPTFTVCDATLPPAVPVKVSVLGVTDNPGLPTTMVTNTTTVLEADDDTRTIAPVYVPSASDPGATLTARLPGVFPEVGETLSQLPPLLVERVADQGMDPPDVNELVMFTVCAGMVPPAAPWKDSEVAEDASVPSGVTVSVTLMVGEVGDTAEET